MRLDHLLSMENVEDAESIFGNRVEQKEERRETKAKAKWSRRKILIVVQFSVTDGRKAPSKGV